MQQSSCPREYARHRGRTIRAALFSAGLSLPATDNICEIQPQNLPELSRIEGAVLGGSFPLHGEVRLGLLCKYIRCDQRLFQFEWRRKRLERTGDLHADGASYCWIARVTKIGAAEGKISRTLAAEFKHGGDEAIRECLMRHGRRVAKQWRPVLFHFGGVLREQCHAHGLLIREIVI